MCLIMESVVLESAENKQFTVNRKVAEQSNLIKSLLEDCGMTNEPIILPAIESPLLEKVIVWLNEKVDKPFNYVTEKREEVLDENGKVKEVKVCHLAKPSDLNLLTTWDEEFFGNDANGIIDLYKAGNYLNIYELYTKACMMIAKNLTGMTTEQMREYLGVVNDFTPEEEEEIKKSTSWMQGL